jgi:hypothetical protein
MEANSIGHVLRRNSRVKICRGVLMDESRPAVSLDESEAYFHRFVAGVDGTLLTLFLMLMRWVTKSGRIVKKDPVCTIRVHW